MKRLIHYMVWGSVAALSGCVTPPPPSVAGDAVSVETVSAASPARLSVGEKLWVHVRYRLETEAAALLFVRPYHGGAVIPGHLANVAVPVGVGAGSADGWVSFATDASVDEVRASLVTLPHYRILAETGRAVDLTWR